MTLKISRRRQSANLRNRLHLKRVAGLVMVIKTTAVIDLSDPLTMRRKMRALKKQPRTTTQRTRRTIELIPMTFTLIQPGLSLNRTSPPRITIRKAQLDMALRSWAREESTSTTKAKSWPIKSPLAQTNRSFTFLRLMTVGRDRKLSKMPHLPDFNTDKVH